QAGMYLKWRRERAPGWGGHALLNGVGAVLTTILLGVVAVAKFGEGAWLIVGLIPLLVLAFRGIRGHYDNVARQLSLKEWTPDELDHNTVVVPISGVHRAVVRAIQYARTLSPDVRAVDVETEPDTTA